MRSKLFRRWRECSGGFLCGLPVAGGHGGTPAQNSFLPDLPGPGVSLTILGLVAAAVAAAIWMFKRWGGGSAGSAPSDDAGEAVRARAGAEAETGGSKLWEEFERETARPGEEGALAPAAEGRQRVGV